MKAFEDYYMILQLHHLAESEVIEGAYKKLAKKYHPDINKTESAGEKMKMINVAYEELSDPAKRQAYDRRWKAAQPTKTTAHKAYNAPQEKYESGFFEAKSALNSYFQNIKNNRFDYSYNLATNIDKQNISCEDFIRWQRAVASVFLLKEYSYQVERAHKNKLLDGKIVQELVEFSVEVVEYNVVMNRVERDSFIKKVILEKDGWHVHIGHEKLQPIIGRFKELTDLLAAKSVMSELSELYSKRDALTGLPNRKGMTEEIENEIQRFERYGHVFSLLIIKVDIKKILRQHLTDEAYEQAMKSISEKLSVNLRKTDVVGRWDAREFLALLPETAEEGTAKAVSKLLLKLNNHTFLYNGKLLATSVEIKATEYKISLKESLNKLYE